MNKHLNLSLFEDIVRGKTLRDAESELNMSVERINQELYDISTMLLHWEHAMPKGIALVRGRWHYAYARQLRRNSDFWLARAEQWRAAQKDGKRRNDRQ